MKLAIVILHWEDVKRTRHCLTSVLAAASFAKHVCSSSVYIVDNGSKKPFSLEETSLYTKPDIKLIRNTQNLGFARGMNVGIDAALKNNIDAVWLLNNDTELELRSIAAMVAYHTLHPNYACLGSVIVDKSGQRVLTVGGYRYQPWLSRAIPLGTDCDVSEAPEQTQSYDYVCGSAIFLTADCLKKTGGIPDHNFLYFEELYFSKKLKLLDLESGVCPNAVIVHHQGSAMSILPSERRHSYLTISALSYTRHYHLRYLPTVTLARLLRACLLTLKAFDLAPLKGFLVGLRAFSSGKQLREI